MRQKLHVYPRQSLLARCPRHLLGDDATAAAIYPPHGIFKEHRDVPDRNELESARLQCVIARADGFASRADRATIRSRDHFNNQTQATGLVLPFHVPVYERLELLHSVQNSLQLHPVFVSWLGLLANTEYRIWSRVR